MSSHHAMALEALNRAAMSAGQYALNHSEPPEFDEDRLTEEMALELAIEEWCLNPCAISFEWERTCRLDCSSLSAEELRVKLRDDVGSMSLPEALAALYCCAPEESFALVCRIRDLSTELGKQCHDVRVRAAELLEEDAHA